MYKPNVGDVVYDNGIKMVVIGVNIREDIDSWCYDRSYKLCSLEEIKGKDFIDYDKVGYWIEVKGVKFPEITQCTDIAPFEIIKANFIKVRQKQKKIITIYE